MKDCGVGVQCFGYLQRLRDDFWGVIQYFADAEVRHIEPLISFGDRFSRLEQLEQSELPQEQRDRIKASVNRMWLASDFLNQKAEMEKRGVHVYSCHLEYMGMEEELKEIEILVQKTGIKHFVVSGMQPYTPQYCASFINQTVQLAKLLEPYGATVSIHNHEKEMKMIETEDGTQVRILNYLVRECEKQNQKIGVQLDVGWVEYAGVSPVQLIDELDTYLTSIHVKDMKVDHAKLDRSDVDTPVGTGCVDFVGILNKLRELGIEEDMLYIIDQDESDRDICEDFVQSVRYFTKLRKSFKRRLG